MCAQSMGRLTRLPPQKREFRENRILPCSSRPRPDGEATGATIGICRQALKQDQSAGWNPALNAGLPHVTNPVYPTASHMKVFGGGAGESRVSRDGLVGPHTKSGFPMAFSGPLSATTFSGRASPRADRGVVG